MQHVSSSKITAFGLEARIVDNLKVPQSWTCQGQSIPPEDAAPRLRFCLLGKDPRLTVRLFSNAMEADMRPIALDSCMYISCTELARRLGILQIQQVNEESIANAIKKRAEQRHTAVLSAFDIMIRSHPASCVHMQGLTNSDLPELLGHKLTGAIFWQITQKAVQTLNRLESEFTLENLPGSFLVKFLDNTRPAITWWPGCISDTLLDDALDPLGEGSRAAVWPAYNWPACQNTAIKTMANPSDEKFHPLSISNRMQKKQYESVHWLLNGFTLLQEIHPPSSPFPGIIPPCIQQWKTARLVAVEMPRYQCDLAHLLFSQYKVTSALQRLLFNSTRYDLLTQALRLAKALHYLHGQQVIYGDLSHKNTLVKVEEGKLVLDFSDFDEACRERDITFSSAANVSHPQLSASFTLGYTSIEDHAILNATALFCSNSDPKQQSQDFIKRRAHHIATNKKKDVLSLALVLWTWLGLGDEWVRTPQICWRKSFGNSLPASTFTAYRSWMDKQYGKKFTQFFRDRLLVEDPEKRASTKELVTTLQNLLVEGKSSDLLYQKRPIIPQEFL